MATERRRKQIARRIQQRLGELLLHEIKDPRAGFLTITSVEVNVDLTLATVYYSVLGEGGARRKAESMLEHARGFLRTEVAHYLDLRTAPQLSFKYDEGLAHARRIDEILDEVLPRDRAGDEAADDGEADQRPAAE